MQSLMLGGRFWREGAAMETALVTPGPRSRDFEKECSAGAGQ